ncbi:MAG: AMP-binding protein [Pelomonas sp.]|nr:AMP-binding protein [Roseateles sp.]
MAERDPYAQLYAQFRWQCPGEFSIADACCARWARETPDAPAVIFEGPTGCRAQYSFGQLQRAANRLANALTRLGIQAGARVGIVLPQRFEAIVAHIAIMRIGAVALPVSLQLSGPAQAARLRAGAAALAIVDCTALAGLRRARGDCPELRRLIVVGECPPECDELPWMQAVQAEDARCEPVALQAEAPALLLDAKAEPGSGALLPQRALIGHLSGFIASQNWFGFDPDAPAAPSQAVFWTASDWAGSAALLDGVLPALYFGRPVLAWQGRFDATRVLELMRRHRVSHALLSATVLDALVATSAAARGGVRLQGLAADVGELGGATLDAAREAFGVPVNTLFARSGIGAFVGHCTRFWDTQPGSLGRAYPGHRVAVIDAAGQPCPPGVVGELALHRRDVHGDLDPIFFLPAAGGAARVHGDWWRSGARALQDEAGVFWRQSGQGAGRLTH